MTVSEKIQSKSFSHINDFLPLLRLWKKEKKRIVFTNGCFDILHAGHVDYLSKAADLGDVLIIGLNSDSSVKRLKGSHRPINDQKSRMQLLASLFFVDSVVIFEQETPYELISIIQPQLLVKGGDYKAGNVIGNEIVKANGGETIILDLIPGYSTTLIEQKIIEEFQKKL